MLQSLASFRAALLMGWMALGGAGFLYARDKGIPVWATIPILAAFLLEYSFYLVPGFVAARERVEHYCSKSRLPLCMSLTALAPYLVYSLGTGQFRWQALGLLAALVLAVCCWYLILPPSPPADLALLAVLVAVVLGKFFEGIYTAPVPGLKIQILGQVMLIRLGAMVMLLIRRVNGIGFGFVPAKEDWKIGLQNFLYFMPIGFPLAFGLGLIRFDWRDIVLWKTLATFLGVLWVVALSEEFFFRGLLQHWLETWTRRPRLALVLASILFALAHLGFRSFPNWRFALVAGIAGWFYGRAYNQAHNIRAGMVTHALVVTAWRIVG